jgi:hypothetical protein
MAKKHAIKKKKKIKDDDFFVGNEEKSGMEEAMRSLDSVIIKDVQGNIVHVGSWVKTEPIGQEEQDWYDVINDPNGEVIVEDVGIANGSLYDPDYNPGEPPRNEVLTLKNRLKELRRG